LVEVANRWTMEVASLASAVRDDCANAAILVLKAARPRGSTSAAAAVGAGDVLDVVRMRSTPRPAACAWRGLQPSVASGPGPREMALLRATRLPMMTGPGAVGAGRDAEKP
jgi:hypothetical protein